ncbi:sugar ABC transporter ATP-binding protein [Asaia prunellae]|uniref:sugar ABC transporter ATP-binding protein n=1 Tax=Asaia prunellae TaxID=610245 RepID=UPI000A813870|nr:sugar ABC transporter ATP-binding protein [Asaia prunellae]
MIGDLCRQGVSVVYVSHKLDEVMRICKRGTILRDGRHISEVTLQDLGERDLVSMMVGREISTLAHESFQTTDIALTARNLCWGKKVSNVSLDLHKGEVLGIAGLVGAGRTELLQLLAGAEKPDSGEIRVNGKITHFRNTRDAIALGIGLVPEERKRDGIIPLRSALSNTAITSLGRFTRLGQIRNRQMRKRITALYGDLQLRPMDPDKPVRLFSGGNQQKVILARWMLADTEILLLDEPTRGIDVGAKQEIYRLIRMLASEGKAIIVVSSELLEIMTVSDRVLVMRAGHVAATLERNALSEESIAHYAAETLKTVDTELAS